MKWLKDKIKWFIFGGVAFAAVVGGSFDGEPTTEERVDAIKNLVVMDGEIKNVYFTDDNSEETFIIKTDDHNYYGFGGNSLVYFSVTNVSNTEQNALVAFSFSQSKYVASVSRNDGDHATSRIIRGTATTSDRTVWATSTIWSDLAIEEITPPNVLRKSVDGRETKKGFMDTFKPGETKYYKASVRIPLGTQNDEWFIEAFGTEGDYGHLDPNLWTYEEKFNTLTDGNLTGQNSWTNDNEIPQVTTAAAALYEGAKGVTYDGSTGNHYTNAKRSITGVESGTVYTSLKITNNDNIVRVSAGATGAILTMHQNGNWFVYNGTTYTDTGIAYNANQYYRVGIQFETSGNAYEGLSADTWKYNLDNGSWSTAYSLYTAATSIGEIHIFGEFDITNVGIMYFDYISPEYAAASPAAASTASDEVLFFNF